VGCHRLQTIPEAEAVAVVLHVYRSLCADRLRGGGAGFGEDDLARFKQRSPGIHEATEQHRCAHLCSSLPLQRNRHLPAAFHRQRAQISVICST